MSQHTRVAHRPPADGPTVPLERPRADLGRGSRNPVRNLFRAVHRFFISKRTGLTLILAMGFLALIGTLLEQVPDHVQADPQAYAQWVESVRPKYGGWTTPLKVAGMFDVFSSIWFKAVTALLAISILACTAHRTPQLWKRAMQPRTNVPAAFFSHARLRSSVVVQQPPEKTFEYVQKALRGRRFRVITDNKGPGLNLYADRFRFTPFGTVLSHVGFVLILLGVLLSAITGFKDTQFTVPVGSRVDVGHDTGLVVEATSFSDTYYEDGSPKDYASELVLYENGAQVASQTVRVNHPMRWNGVSFYQSYFGIAAELQVRDGSGKILFDSSVPLEWGSDDGMHSIGQFELSDQNLSVYVITASSGQVAADLRPGEVQLEIYKDGTEQPVAIELVSQGESVTVSGLDYSFQRERQFAGLIVARDPGAVWVWIGSALMVLGFFLVFFLRHRRIWVRVTETPDGSGVHIASSDRRDTGFESGFRQFAADIASLEQERTEHQEKVGATDA